MNWKLRIKHWKSPFITFFKKYRRKVFINESDLIVFLKQSIAFREETRKISDNILIEMITKSEFEQKIDKIKQYITKLKSHDTKISNYKKKHELDIKNIKNELSQENSNINAKIQRLERVDKFLKGYVVLETVDFLEEKKEEFMKRFNYEYEKAILEIEKTNKTASDFSNAIAIQGKSIIEEMRRIMRNDG